MARCEASSPAVLDSTGNRGQNITLKCDKSGKHLVHEDQLIGAKFMKVGKGGLVWPSKLKR